MNHCRLEEILSGASKKRIVVFGDLMLDEYIWGSVDRISPEAPVQVVNVKSGEIRPGGAGNVASNLKSLGCQVELFGLVGQDNEGDKLLDLLSARQIGVSRVVRRQGYPTTQKSRLLSGNQQIVRIDREEQGGLSENEASIILKELESDGQCWSAFILSDYNKGVLTADLCRKLIDLAIRLNIPVIVDPKGKDFSKYKGATVITPNRKELALASDTTFTTDEEMVAAASELRETLFANALLLTRSEQGMTIIQQGAQPVHLAAEAREVFDVSGAGDTVVAVLGFCLSSQLSLEESAELANIAGGLVVARVGTSTLSPQELLAAVIRLETRGSHKEHTSEYLAKLLDEIKGQGKRVVFTNGCFDLLHAGHVRYLQQARQCGDLLVLGLNSDESIRRLKGPKRPLLEQRDRALVLAALECIDYIVTFDEDTPYELIKELQPDILVKGGDYKMEEVVGRDIVEANGGEVRLIPFVEGRSTSRIVDSILERYSEEPS